MRQTLTSTLALAVLILLIVPWIFVPLGRLVGLFAAFLLFVAVVAAFERILHRREHPGINLWGAFAALIGAIMIGWVIEPVLDAWPRAEDTTAAGLADHPSAAVFAFAPPHVAVHVGEAATPTGALDVYAVSPEPGDPPTAWAVYSPMWSDPDSAPPFAWDGRWARRVSAPLDDVARVALSTLRPEVIDPVIIEVLVADPGDAALTALLDALLAASLLMVVWVGAYWWMAR